VPCHFAIHHAQLAGLHGGIERHSGLFQNMRFNLFMASPHHAPQRHAAQH
jgi:hypothetical protein